MLWRLVCPWTRLGSRLFRAEYIISYFLSADSDILSLCVAHVIQGLLILAGTRVIVPFRLVFGAHRGNSLDVVEC